MPLVPIAFPKQSNPAAYKASGNVRSINCSVEALGEEGKSPLVLRGTHGLKTFSDVGSNLPFRGVLALDYALYCVIGYELYKIAPNGSYTALGSIAGQGQVYMAANRHSPTQIAIVTESGQDYVLEGDELVRNPDEDLIAPNSVTFLNGYIVYSHLDGRITSTDIDNAKSVNALNYDTAEFNRDNLLRLVSRGSELMAFGEKSIEIWAPAAGEGLPFLRAQVIPHGCLTGRSVQVFDGSAFWIADDRTVRAAAGYDPQVISNPAVDRQLREVADTGQLSSMYWSDSGHNYYAITHPDFTWVYDLKTGLWHERKSHGRDNWRCVGAIEFQGKKLWGDALTGVIYQLDDTPEETGQPVEMKFTVPVHSTPSRVTLNALHIDVVTGQSFTGDEGFINLRVSKDNGHTFGPTRKLSLGRPGQHTKRIKTNRFGTSKEDGFLLEVSCSSNCVREINGMYADIEKIGV